MKTYLPVQETIIYKLNNTANLTINTIQKILQAIKEHKQADCAYFEAQQKSIMNKS